MKKAVVVLLVLVALLALVAVATASTTSSAAAVPVAQASTPVAASATTLETCIICHKNSGTTHQASYNQMFQDEVIEVSDIKYSFTANPDTTVVTFKLLKNGQPLEPSEPTR